MLALLFIAPLLYVTPAHSASIPLPIAADVADMLIITNEHGEPLAGTRVDLPFDATTGRFRLLEIPFRIFTNAPDGRFMITTDIPTDPVLRAGPYRMDVAVLFQGANLNREIQTKMHKDLFPNVVVTRAGAASSLLKLIVQQAKPELPAVGRYTGKFALKVTYRP